MSNFDVVTKKRLDPRINVDASNKEFIVDVAGNQVTAKVEPAQSYSNSQINFNITPSSPNTVIDRGFFVEVRMKYNFTGRANTNTDKTFQKDLFAPRGFSYGIQSANLTINGLSISQEVQQIVHAQAHFNDKTEYVRGQTLSPTFHCVDGYQSYDQPSASSSLMHPLRSYNSSTRAEFGKGSYKMEITDNSIETGEVLVTYYEYMSLSPAIYNNRKCPGLTNVTSLQLSLNLSNLERTFGLGQVGDPVADTKYPTGVTAVIVDIPKCHYTEISMPVYIESPPVVTYSYTDIQRQESGLTAIADGATAILNSNSYQLNTVPHSVIIFAKEQYSDITSKANLQSVRKLLSTPDCYGTIEKLEIKYNNQILMSSASQSQLWQMSSRNGLDMSFVEFCGLTQEANASATTGRNVALVGSLVCLNFGSDLAAADPTMVPGTSINSNFQVSATVKNQSGFNKNYVLQILYVYDGILSVSPGSAYKYVSLMNRSETLNLEIEDTIETTYTSGGDFRSVIEGVKSGLKKAAPFLKPLVSTGLDVVADVASPLVTPTVAKKVREGVKSVTGLGLQGGGLQGGAVVTKSGMANRM